MASPVRRAALAAAVALLPVITPVGVAHAAAPSFPAHYAAPYLEISASTAGDMEADRLATGLKYYTLAFLIPKSGCTPQWENGNYALNTFKPQIEALQAKGGNVIVSFGGAAGGELALTCTSVPALQAAYANVVNTLGIKRLDFDIEGGPLNNTASVARRNQALAALQAADPSVEVDFTLPVDPGGLPGNALNLLKDAKAKGVKVNVVNIMTMDFGDGHNALNDAITAANGTHTQLGALYPGLSSEQLWNLIGLTPIAGKNDDNENFTQADAVTLENFAAARGVQELAFWEVHNYDKKVNYNYSRTFNKITSGVGDDFSLSFTPPSGQVTAGGTATSTLHTAVTSGTAKPITLSASGSLPPGATASIAPSSVTAGGDATLTVTTTSTTPNGTYPITVTGTSGTVSHSATYTLTVGTTTPTGKIEAENATITQGVVESNHAGFSGTGFVNYDNVVGSAVEFTVTAAQAGPATLTFRFANGTAVNRPMTISVNGTAVATSVAFNGTGAWTTWQSTTVPVTLAAGVNKVKATATTANGGPNLDYLSS